MSSPSILNLARASLLVAAATAHHISSTPPKLGKKTDNKLLSGEETSDFSKKCDVLHGPLLINHVGIFLVRMSPYTVWLLSILEVTARLLSLYPSSEIARTILPLLLPRGISFQYSTAFNTTFVLSSIALFAGYRIRRACFAALGKQFTFTHTTLSEHALITGGPYSIVRHASYSGEALVRGGMICMLLSPGSWLRQCSGAPVAVVAGAIMGFHVVWAIFNTSFLFWRSTGEDATLREKFGVEWEAYRRQVPYKFVPFVA